MLTRLLERLNLVRPREPSYAESRLARATADLEASSVEVRKVALDHAESTDHVRTTVSALLDRMQRRELREDEENPQ